MRGGESVRMSAPRSEFPAGHNVDREGGGPVEGRES